MEWLAMETGRGSRLRLDSARLRDFPAPAGRWRALRGHSPYGLTVAVLIGDPERGLVIADQLEAGIVHVNDQAIHDEPQMPFGGVKHSGWGRFGVSFAVEEFTELHWVTIKRRPRTFPF